MKRIVACCTLVAVSLTIGLEQCSAASSKTVQKQPVNQTEAASVKVMLDSIGKYISAGDASGFTALWTEDASYTDDSGSNFTGRENLKKRFTDAFQGEKTSVTLKPTSIKFLSPTVAVSDGDVLRKDANGQEIPDTRYSLVMAKQAGKWMIANASETAVNVDNGPTNSADALKDLEWMLGDWKAERNGSKLNLHVDWADNKKFLRWNYQIAKAGEPLQTNTEIIGFDPNLEEIVSWSFDTNGAFGQASWQKNDKDWQMNSVKTAPDGSRLTASNIITPNKSGFSWQSINRTAAGMPLSDTGELQIERVSR
jgi:uncharacterized protein (TIGR02246 family)